jgi:hypothetical protein
VFRLRSKDLQLNKPSRTTKEVAFVCGLHGQLEIDSKPSANLRPADFYRIRAEKIPRIYNIRKMSLAKLYKMLLWQGTTNVENAHC